MYKSINLDQFITKSKQKNEEKMKLSTIYIKSYDADFPLISLGFSKVTSRMDDVDTNSISGTMEFYKELIYDSMPMLKSPELHAEYSCPEPFDIVDKVFSMSEIKVIAEHILTFNGIDTEVDDVKN